MQISIFVYLSQVISSLWFIVYIYIVYCTEQNERPGALKGNWPLERLHCQVWGHIAMVTGSELTFMHTLYTLCVLVRTGTLGHRPPKNTEVLCSLECSLILTLDLWPDWDPKLGYCKTKMCDQIRIKPILGKIMSALDVLKVPSRLWLVS